MTVEQIKTGEDLQKYMINRDVKFDELWARVNDLTKSGWLASQKSGAGQGISDKTAEGLGNWFKAAFHGELPDYHEKVGLGTPLTGDSGTGAYLIPVQYISDVYRVVEERSELLPLVGKVQMTSRTCKIPKKLTAPSFTYVATEGADVTESGATFAQTELIARSYALWLAFSLEMLDDNIIGLGRYLADILAESWQSKFESELLMGSGTPMTGLFKTTSATTNVVRMGGTTFGTLTFTDVQNLISGLSTRAKRRGARFIMSPQVFDIISGVRNAQGDPLFRELREKNTLCGYQFILSDEAPDLTDDGANKAMLAFGNPAYMTYGDRIALEIKFFDSTEYAVKNLEVFFRARVRMALDVTQPQAFSVLWTST